MDTPTKAAPRLIAWKDQTPEEWRKWTPPPEPSIVVGMPDDFYHGHAPGYSSSQLKLIIQKSELHLKHKLEHPEPPRDPKEKPNARLLGSILHAFALEPHTIEERFCFAPGLTLSKNDDKAEFEGLKKLCEKDGRQLVRCDPEAQERVAAAVHKHPAWKYIAGDAPLAEASIFWTDPETALPLKIRPDCLNLAFGRAQNRALCGDLKSIEDATDYNFRSQVKRYAYDLSAAMYQDGVRQLTGLQTAWAWFVFEKAPPHATRVIYPGEKWISRGRELYCEAKDRLAQALRSGYWPGFDKGQPVVLEWTRWDELDRTKTTTPRKES